MRKVKKAILALTFMCTLGASSVSNVFAKQVRVPDTFILNG